MTIAFQLPVRSPRARAHSAAVVAALLVIAAVPAVIAAQVAAGDGYDSVTDPLSSLYWTREGWWFPVAVALFGVGSLAAAAAIGLRGAFGRACPILLGLAGLGAATAAVFPADPLQLSWVGELHRAGSLLILVAPLVAALVARVDGRAVFRTDPVLRAMLAVAAGSGTWFLAGFVAWSASSVDDLPASTIGLSQRILAVAVIAVVARLGLRAVGRGPAT